MSNLHNWYILNYLKAFLLTSSFFLSPSVSDEMLSSIELGATAVDIDDKLSGQESHSVNKDITNRSNL